MIDCDNVLVQRYKSSIEQIQNLVKKQKSALATVIELQNDLEANDEN